MPSYRRPREKTQRQPARDAERDDHLLSGPVMPGWGFDRKDGTFDEAAAKAYWEKHRERLLRTWIGAKPGARPWFWWLHESKPHEGGLRRRTDGKIHPFDDVQRKLRVAKSDDPSFWRKAYSTHWGLPGCFVMPFDEDLYRDFMAHRLDTKLFEPEWSFLVRHGLLLPEDSP